MKINYGTIDTSVIAVKRDDCEALVDYLETTDIVYYYHWVPVMELIDQMNRYIDEDLTEGLVNDIFYGLDWLNMFPMDYKKVYCPNEIKTYVNSYFIGRECSEDCTVDLDYDVAFVIEEFAVSEVETYLTEHSVPFIVAKDMSKLKVTCEVGEALKYAGVGCVLESDVVAIVDTISEAVQEQPIVKYGMYALRQTPNPGVEEGEDNDRQIKCKRKWEY